MERQERFHPGSLYLVLSETYGRGRGAHAIARRAIAGGVDVIQMREKDKPAAELKALGAALGDLCRESGVVFIVNDDPRLACELGADGVHMGQEDIAAYGIEAVRTIVGPGKIIGVSTHSIDQALNALALDIDYLAFGPIFPTQTKNYCIGAADVCEILALGSKPVFLIGGIQSSNLDILLEKGATRIALIRDIMEADDVEKKTRWYKQKLEDQRRALPDTVK